MINHWKIINSLKTKIPLEKEFIINNLNKTLLINYLSQNENTVDISLYISKDMLNSDIYNIYLYTLSKFPKDLDFRYIKANDNSDLNLLLNILNSNSNDILNILKTIDENLLNKIKEKYCLLNDNNELFENDLEKENYYLNIRGN